MELGGRDGAVPALLHVRWHRTAPAWVTGRVEKANGWGEGLKEPQDSARTEASGVVVRQGNPLGFAHHVIRDRRRQGHSDRRPHLGFCSREGLRGLSPMLVRKDSRSGLVRRPERRANPEGSWEVLPQP
jgi:hypothetical protein